ncbi:MAG: hypothetical protein EAZ53_05545 [Bacteroidetes bacterium]|nr:MAG: hypothetical protein EAZ53_05545 [Bacteroidota bacterium]
MNLSDRTYFTNKVIRKYNIGKNQFSSSFFFSFGFSENIYDKGVASILKTDTNSALISDWLTVGADFKKVIDKELSHS